MVLKHHRGKEGRIMFTKKKFIGEIEGTMDPVSA